MVHILAWHHEGRHGNNRISCGWHQSENYADSLALRMAFLLALPKNLVHNCGFRAIGASVLVLFGERFTQPRPLADQDVVIQNGGICRGIMVCNAAARPENSASFVLNSTPAGGAIRGRP